MNQDLCNAIIKVASKRFICELATSHLRRDGTPHRDGDFTWKDSPMGGETLREF